MCVVQTLQLWREHEPGLAKLVSPNRLMQRYDWLLRNFADAGSHIEKLVTYKLSSRKINTQNDLY